MTVKSGAGAENAILGGAALNPLGNPGSYNGFDNVADASHRSFEECHPTGFALNHLVKGACRRLRRVHNPINPYNRSVPEEPAGFSFQIVRAVLINACEPWGFWSCGPGLPNRSDRRPARRRRRCRLIGRLRRLRVRAHCRRPR